MRRSLVSVATCFALVMIVVPPALVAGESLVAAPAFGAPACPPGQPGSGPPGQPGPGSAPGRPSTYPLGQCELLLSSGVIPAGGTVTVTGTGYETYVNVTITLNPGGTQLGSARTGSNGSFTSNVTVPASTVPGTYLLTATGGGQSLSAQLVVTSATVVNNASSNGTAPNAVNTASGSPQSNSGSSGSSHSSALGSPSSSGTGPGGSGTGGSGTGSSGTPPMKLAAPAPVGSHSKGSHSLMWIGGGALALVIVAAGLLLAIRARRAI